MGQDIEERADGLFAIIALSAGSVAVTACLAVGVKRRTRDFARAGLACDQETCTQAGVYDVPLGGIVLRHCELLTRCFVRSWGMCT